MPSTAKVGGFSYVVGSWGQYEIDRRNIIWNSNDSANSTSPGKAYGGRTYIHASDAVQSIINAHPQNIIQAAALHLADILSKLEEKLCEPDESGVWECEPISLSNNKVTPEAYYLVTPSITSDDLRNFANEDATDVMALYDISKSVTDMAALFKTYLPPLNIHESNTNKFPILPTQTISITDDGGILQLESDVAPYINSLEKLQAAVAEQFDITATAIEKTLNKIQTNKPSNKFGGRAPSSNKSSSDKSSSNKSSDKSSSNKSSDKSSDKSSKKSSSDKSSKKTSKKQIDDLDSKIIHDLDSASIHNLSSGIAHSLKPRSSKTRGDDIDLASKSAPLYLLNVALPFAQSTDTIYQRFDIKNETFTPSDTNGIYYVLFNRNNPSRTTALTPLTVSKMAFNTSGRMFAWYLIDSPEARYLFKASSKNGKIVNIDADIIIEWLKPKMTGNPPHKLTISEYIKYLKSYDIEIYEKVYNDDVIRFDLISSTTVAERTQELAKLRSLTKKDFDELDWSAYNRDAAVEACKKINETAGDVIIDLVAKTVSAPKVRQGLMWGVHTHVRSYITFHTHPSVRYQGTHAEYPSEADVMRTLETSAFDIQAWAFVSAPEGTYIIRPSRALIIAYLNDPQYIRDTIPKLYLEGVRTCKDSVKVCIQQTINILTELGFIAYFHDNPCINLLQIPDIVPDWNRQDSENKYLSFTNISNMSADELFNINWDSAIAVSDIPTIRIASWLTANIEAKTKLLVIIDSHGIEDIYNFKLYPNTPGPLFIIYFPEESQFPLQIPHVALNVALHAIDEWAWIIFLSATRITIFRSNKKGVEIHGPKLRKT